MLALGAALSGCAAGEAPKAPPRPAYVSLERLAARHPLWDDLSRLEDAARQLRRLRGSAGGAARSSGGGASVPPGRAAADHTLSPLVLPALPAGNVRAEQGRLRAVGEQRLADFAQRLAAQQERGIGRRRAELEAVAAARQAQRRRDAEAGIYARARAIREQNAARAANLRIRINTLLSRIAIVPPPPERDVLEARIKEHRAELAALRAEAEDAEEQARREVRERLASAAWADAALVERLLDEERARLAQGTQRLVRAQRSGLEQELAQIVAPTNFGGSAAGPYVIEAPVAGEAVSDAGIARAAAGIAEQRERLRRFILADVEAAVRDVAAAHRIQVTFDSAAAAPNTPDRTAEFAEWIAGRVQGTKGNKT